MKQLYSKDYYLLVKSYKEFQESEQAAYNETKETKKPAPKKTKQPEEDDLAISS